MERYDPFDGALGFSLATRVAGLVWSSGMVGIRTDGSVPDSIEDQLRVAYSNIGSILETQSSSLAAVIDQTIFFVGSPEVATAAASVVRPEVFGDEQPCSTMVGVSALVDPRFLVEVKVVAAVGDPT